MPGKHLEYIKAGRYVVPVELSFLPTKQLDVMGRESSTSKWVERRHWKEIKAMLKPAVEAVAKYNESGTEKISKSHHVAFGHEIAFGYVIHLNKDKCPFLAVLDPKKNCWTDDEQDSDIDENSGIGDFGGRHKSYTPTKCYIRACSVKKTGSESEDGRRIRKELGVKNDDVRNYFQPRSTASGSGAALSSSTNQVLPVASHEKHKSKTHVRKKEKKKLAERRNFTNNHLREDYSSSEESLMDLPPTGTGCPPPTSTYDMRSSVHYRSTARVNENLSASHCLVSDTHLNTVETNQNIDTECGTGKGGVFSDSVDDVFSTSSLFRNWIEDDDFDEELPDIEEPCSHTIKKGQKSGGSRKKSLSDRNFAKNSSGLPDIDEACRRAKRQKKRNVAIVEPMKHMKATCSAQMSFEEAVGAMGVPVVERRRKGRATSSPTIERLLNSRSKNSNSAIEILGEDSDLLSERIPQVSATQKKRRQNSGSTRKRRTRKRVTSSINERLTPSPFPESPEDVSQEYEDGNIASQESNSESDVEMPVLTKMVMTSDDDLENGTENDIVTLPESPRAVPALEMEQGIIAFGSDTQKEPQIEDSKIAESQPAERVRGRSPSPDIAERGMYTVTNIHRVVDKPSYGSDNSQISHSQTSSFMRKRIKHTSDSDDITSESAYRKTPIRRKRRKCTPARPLSAISFSDTSESHLCNNSSTNKETGDAQTQTRESTVQTSDSSEKVANHRPTQNVRTTVPITKMERLEDCQAYDSDYAHVVVSEGDDDEVLFAGQYQAIPVTDSSKTGVEIEDDDEELFSFDRPASVKIESLSINSVVAAAQPQTLSSNEPDISIDDDSEYVFNYVARARARASQSSSINSVQGSANVLEALSDSPREREEGDNEPVVEEPENLSMYQLMNHPGTLHGGFGYLGKVMSSNGNGNKRDKKRVDNKEKDSDLMPPPLIKPPLSPDICSLNPEQRVLKSKFRKEKDSGEINTAHRSDSPIPGPSSGIRSSQVPPGHIYDVDCSSEDEGHYETDPRETEPYFREFMSRAQEPEKEYEPQGDEYDLTQSSQCMLNVVQDYAEKSRQYKKHKKKIDELTMEQFKRYFELVKPQILGIFSGTVESQRNKLYCSRKPQDKRILKRLQVIRPFNAEHGTKLYSWLYEVLVPPSGSTLKCTDYINYVMLPEAFTRIFAYANNISCDTAEKEMVQGPRYDGPYLES